MAGISKSQVSRLCAEIDQRVRTFLERPIEGDWPTVDRRHLREGARGRAHRLGRGRLAPLVDAWRDAQGFLDALEAVPGSAAPGGPPGDAQEPQGAPGTVPATPR